jgi:hypothetical protein
MKPLLQHLSLLRAGHTGRVICAICRGTFVYRARVIITTNNGSCRKPRPIVLGCQLKHSPCALHFTHHANNPLHLCRITPASTQLARKCWFRTRNAIIIYELFCMTRSNQFTSPSLSHTPCALSPESVRNFRTSTPDCFRAALFII